MNVLLFSVLDDFFDDSPNVQILNFLYTAVQNKSNFLHVLNLQGRNTFLGPRLFFEENYWLTAYNDAIFHRFFRMSRDTYYSLLHVIQENYIHQLLTKKYRGGNIPLDPERSLLIFLWFMATQDTLQCIGYSFGVAASTVMHVINSFLYTLIGLKNKFIFWPKTEDEFIHINNGFKKYPGAIGAIDGSHVDITVPADQHDSYVDRYQGHSINLLAICSAEKILTYVFVGYPGSAHDARVFSESGFVKNIMNFGPTYYFPSPDYHIIGDSAFPIKRWLMTPYKKVNNLTRIERQHNYFLSSDRICIENVFGLIKGRWRRTIFINTYNVSKAIEIVTAACVLHNFCYFSKDVWLGNIYKEKQLVERDFMLEENPRETLMGQQKRNIIARNLFFQEQ